VDSERVDFYANSVNVATGIYDITLHFRTQTPVTIEDGKPPLIETTDIFNVRMSPQHAKALGILLLKHITDYESKFDLELPVPDNLTELWSQCVDQLRKGAKE
jgi:hypothetical protein